MKFLIGLFTCIILSTSCSSAKANSQSKIMDTNNPSGSYTITALDNVIIPNNLTIDFENVTNKVSGFAGCNRFFGSYTITKNEIQFSDIASTKKFCGKDIGNTERKFIETLSKTESFQIKDNTLMLYNNENTIILTAAKNVDTEKNTTNVVNNYNAIIYKAMSRGSFEYIKISKSKIVISSDRNLQNKTEYTYNSKYWEEISTQLSAIKHDTFINLKAPTNKRLYDGAAHTTLSYIIDDMVFATPTFDEGYPPKAIEAVINKILSIKQNVTKQ